MEKTKPAISPATLIIHSCQTIEAGERSANAGVTALPHPKSHGSYLPLRRKGSGDTRRGGRSGVGGGDTTPPHPHSSSSSFLSLPPHAPYAHGSEWGLPGTLSGTRPDR